MPVVQLGISIGSRKQRVEHGSGMPLHGDLHGKGAVISHERTELLAVLLQNSSTYADFSCARATDSCGFTHSGISCTAQRAFCAS